MEPEIKVQTSIDNRTQLYKIDIALHDLVSHQRVKQYLGEMLAEVIKTALMEHYGDIQKIVDEVVFSPETRKLVEDSIRNEVAKLANQAIQDMFGEK